MHSPTCKFVFNFAFSAIFLFSIFCHLYTGWCYCIKLHIKCDAFSYVHEKGKELTMIPDFGRSLP